MSYFTLLWFLFGTLYVFMLVGYPSNNNAVDIFTGIFIIIFYTGGLYGLFDSIEEQGDIERREFYFQIITQKHRINHRR